MAGIGEDNSGERQGRQERRRWQIPHARGFPPQPGANTLNGETAGSMTRLGARTLAVPGMRRRSLLLGGILVLALMTALVVAQFGGPQGQSGPSPAFAQSGTCQIPTMVLTPGGNPEPGRFEISLTYPLSGADPTGYRFRYRIANPVGAWSPWMGASHNGSTGNWRAPGIAVDLKGETEYNVEAQSACHVGRHSTTVTGNVTTGVVRDFVITLTQNGQEITEIPEGETATLTLALHPDSAVYTRDVPLTLGFLFSGNFNVSPPIPVIEAEELLVSPSPALVGSNGYNAPTTLITGERSVSFAITADLDTVKHDDATNDNEYPLETTAITIVFSPENSLVVRVEGTIYWNFYINVRDGEPPPPVTATPTPSVTPIATTIANPNIADGTVTITDSTPLDDIEIGDTLTATTVATDVDGLTPPTTFTYQWLRDDRAINGETADTYVVTIADIGSMLKARADFVDDLAHAETLTSAPTAEVPSGPVIRAPNGYLWDENPGTDDTITVDTSVMGYSYLPPGSTFTYLWLHVDAGGGTPSTATVPADAESYTLTMADDMKYLQVEVGFTDTNGDLVTKRAIMQTPEITMRPPLEIPMGVTATVPPDGGNVRLNWGLTTRGGNTPAGFRYRYKATALADTAFTAWTNARGGSNARSVTITGDLINNADYTFEVASYSSQVLVSAATTGRPSATAVYKHSTRDCR